MRCAYRAANGRSGLSSAIVFDVANTKAIGTISESVVLSEFLKAGFPVLLPFGDNLRYDMVIEAGGRFLSVQCKTARKIHGGAVVCFNAHSGGFGPGDSVTSRRQSYRGDVDLFAVYSPDTRQVYVLAVEDVGETEVWLRLEPARNNQKARIRWAQDYLLAAWAARLADARRTDSLARDSVL